MSSRALPLYRVAALLAAGLLAACGQRGELYFPEQRREAVPAAPATPASPAQAPAATPADDDDTDDARNAVTPQADPVAPPARRP